MTRIIKLFPVSHYRTIKHELFLIPVGETGSLDDKLNKNRISFKLKKLLIQFKCKRKCRDMNEKRNKMVGTN